MLGIRCFDGESCRRNGISRSIGNAVALRTVCCRRGSIGVYVGQARHYRKVSVGTANVGVAGGACRTCRSGNVVRRLGRHCKVDRAAMALGAVAGRRVRRVSD